MITITLDDAVKHLSAAVAERGEDHVYSSKGSMYCTYIRDGKPDCGVGEVFSRVGINLVANFQGKGVNNNSVRYLELSSLAEPFEIEPKAYEFLSDFQYQQDCHIPWGHALQEALNNITK